MPLLKLIFLTANLLFSQAYANAAWKLQPLAQASNALLVEMDEAATKGLGPCGMKVSQVSHASQKLQSLIDQRIENLKDKKVQVHQLKKYCEADCTCDIYDYALEKLNDLAAKSEKPILFSSSQRKLCRNHNKGFCQSEIFKYLIK